MPASAEVRTLPSRASNWGCRVARCLDVLLSPRHGCFRSAEILKRFLNASEMDTIVVHAQRCHSALPSTASLGLQTGRIKDPLPPHAGPRGKSVGSSARLTCDFFNSYTANQEGIPDQ